MDNAKDIIKKFIINKLCNQEITLDIIKEEIQNIKIIMNSNMKNLVFKNISNLSDEEYEDLRKSLETHFSVKVDYGILLTDNNISRDKHWWSSKSKQTKENYYWNRYRKYIEKRLPNKVVKTLDIDTDMIMDNIENPEILKFDTYGMVVGHVQSGKTGNYSGLICKAADAGYKFIVVIAGGLNNLRNQTQERINEYFVGTDGINDLEIKRLSFYDNSKQPISLTTNTDDFNTKDANKQTINFDNMTGPIILVIKKNVSTLKYVIKWIKSHSKEKVKEHAMLIIDDESDYASINYKEEEDPTQINKGIRKLISLFEKSSYVAYTATPFANIFINHKANNKELGLDLFPKNFIYALDAPSNYMGAKKYFISDEGNLDSPNPYIVEIDDHMESFPFVQKSNHHVKSLPNSLKDAINLFLLNVAIRHLNRQENEHNSMLIHVSRFTNVHEQVSSLVDIYLNKIKDELISFGKLTSPEFESIQIQKLKEVYKQLCLNKVYSFDTIIKKLTDIVSSIYVREVHQKSKLSLVYRKDTPTNVIAVGGTSLSRGYTLEGLSVTYFTRNSIFYDTLMQMGRWFGYRDEYNDLCKVFLPESILNNFIKVTNAIDDLMISLNNMRKIGKTPEEFGLGVQCHPTTKLQITAKNKMKSSKDIPLSLNLDGLLKENALISKNNENQIKILNYIKNLIANIEEKKYKLSMVGSNILWKDVDSKLILNFFKDVSKVIKYDVYGFELGFPIAFIIEKLENLKTNIDVAFFSTKNKTEYITSTCKIGAQERQIGSDGEDFYVINKHKISGPHPERIVLENLKTNLTGKEIRENHMKKPLLMLHLLKLFTKNKKTNDINMIESIFGTYGIAFPSKNNSGNTIHETITLKVNSVYIEDLLKNSQYDYSNEEDYDD